MKFKIYCINLFEREDRYLSMKSQFKKYNLDVCFIRNYKHKLGGRFGCFKSHINCIKNAKKNKLDACLIFEDDVELDFNCDLRIKECLHFINNFNKNIDILFGDCRYLYFDKKYTNNIYSGKCMGAHCYFLHKKSINKILKNYHKFINLNLHYDHFLFLLFNKSFIFIKPIARLLPYGSDNDLWGSNIITILSQKLTLNTVVHFKIRNFLVKFLFLSLIKLKLNKLKNNLISKINNSHNINIENLNLK